MLGVPVRADLRDEELAFILLFMSKFFIIKGQTNLKVRFTNLIESSINLIAPFFSRIVLRKFSINVISALDSPSFILHIYLQIILLLLD